VAIELKVPEIGESITEVLVTQWLVAEGDLIEVDQPVAELETDKATVELPAPQSGRLTKIVVKAGETTAPGAVIAVLEPGEVPATTESEPRVEPTASSIDGEPQRAQVEEYQASEAPPRVTNGDQRVSPAARRLLAEKHMSAADIHGTGKGGMVVKEDVQRAQPAAAHSAMPPVQQAEQPEEMVPMSPIRRTIATRLLQSQQTTAQLTTFQEVDLSKVIELRRRYRESFQQKYGVKLGFMSFFVKAAIEALKAFPAVNAEIRDQTIVYKNYFNIGIAVSGDKGLVVPVLRNAERLSFAELELAIDDFAKRGSQNKIDLQELKGGTFTISNGGVFGSLMSTPILNPPQSGILGLHAIQERPVAIDGQVVIRPMMYMALTYDHRIVDGRESVQFLIRIKEVIEDPARLMLEI